MDIEPGRQLDSEDLGGLVLTPGQIAQLDIPKDNMETVLEPEQVETALVAKQNLVKQVFTYHSYHSRAWIILIALF